MTTIEFFNSLLVNDDTETWNDINDHLYGSDLDQDLDNRIFSWE